MHEKNIKIGIFIPIFVIINTNLEVINMLIDTENIISVTDANRNFTKATKLAEKNGSVVIMKGNKARFILIDIDQNPQLNMTQEEKMEYLGRKILREHLSAFKELAK